MFSRKKRAGAGIFAGLALHGDSLRYVELDGSRGLRVVRQEFIPLSTGTVVKDSLKDTNALGVAFETLKDALGKFTCPIVLGLPSRDVILRLVEYPKMPLEDLKGALALEFQKYFPYAWDDAATDIAEVEVPSPDAAAKTTVLVATCELEKVKALLRVVSRLGMPLAALEPMNVAFFRAALGPDEPEGGSLMVQVEPEVTHIMMGYKDNGILFRSAAVDLTLPEVRTTDEGLMPILRDVQNTLIFVGNQYRGIEVKNLVLGGTVGDNPRLKVFLEAATSLKVTVLDVWDIWKAASPLGSVPGYGVAFGLALRDLI